VVAREVLRLLRRGGQVKSAADTRVEDIYGGWNHSREDIAAEVAARDAFVCEHGFVRSEGCDECASWADGWHRDHEERIRDAE
jgi:hypothetical protein